VFVDSPNGEVEITGAVAEKKMTIASDGQP
jgi:hypothetical protein